jgi:hypothetical protein
MEKSNIINTYVEDLLQHKTEKIKIQIKIIGEKSIFINIARDSLISDLKNLVKQLFNKYYNVEFYTIENKHQEIITNNTFISDIENEEVIFMQNLN